MRIFQLDFVENHRFCAKIHKKSGATTTMNRNTMNCSHDNPSHFIPQTMTQWNTVSSRSTWGRKDWKLPPFMTDTPDRDPEDAKHKAKTSGIAGSNTAQPPNLRKYQQNMCVRDGRTDGRTDEEMKASVGRASQRETRLLLKRNISECDAFGSQAEPPSPWKTPPACWALTSPGIQLKTWTVALLLVRRRRRSSKSQTSRQKIASLPRRRERGTLTHFELSVSTLSSS